MSDADSDTIVRDLLAGQLTCFVCGLALYTDGVKRRDRVALCDYINADCPPPHPEFCDGCYFAKVTA